MAKQLSLELRPRKREDFYGNEGIYDICMKSLRKNSFSHCALLYGPNGTGKSAFAEYIGMSLMCDEHVGRDSLENPDPCCTCPTCRSVLDSNFSRGAIKKFNLPELVKKTEVKDIIKQIFDFEGEHEKSVFILEEFQALKDGYQQFLEYLVKIPDDVYIIITTDDLYSIDMAIQNRCAILKLQNLSINDATDFVLKSSKVANVKCPNKSIAKEFAKCCNLNPRAILNYLDLLRDSEITEQILDSLFSSNSNIVNKIWRSILDKNITTYEFQNYLIKLSENNDLTAIYRRVRETMIKNLMFLDGVTDENYKTSEIREIKDIVKRSLSYYSKVLEALEKNPEDNSIVISILTRAKLLSTVNSTTEKERCSRDMVKSQSTMSLSQQFAEEEKEIRNELRKEL